MKASFRQLGSLILLFSLSGCGTMQTLAPDQGKVKISYNSKKSYCQSIPRIYSGVAHNFCQLYGEPDNKGYNAAAAFPFWASDTVLCAVTDTLVLPYTVTRQFVDGSLKVVR